MDTVVLKFGGSSVADNEKLKLVAKKIINYYNETNRVVVVVSAQGKTTNKLIEEANSLSHMPDKREMDVLLSVGEQITIAKLAILLKEMGYDAISLTGWQIGIYTNDVYQNAIIERINTSRLIRELDEHKIVIVAGFQGIDKNNNITTLGRGGSDTTAVALAAALDCDKCIIFSDVDGVYTADPNKIANAKKLINVSYEEMLEMSNEGSKVLHNRCVEIGEKHDVSIIAKSTFEDGDGTVISNDSTPIEENTVKNIVKKEISRISVIGNGMIKNNEVYKKVMNIIEKNNLEILTVDVTRNKISVVFKNIVPDYILEQLHKEIIE